jgi:hypothetical protein
MHLPAYALNELTEVGVHQEALPVRKDSTVIGPHVTSLAQRQRRREQCRAAQRLYAKLNQPSAKRIEETRRWKLEHPEEHRRHQREYAKKRRALLKRRAALSAGMVAAVDARGLAP